MSPIYEYYCHECGAARELYRSIDRRNDDATCEIGHKAELIISVPALSIWDSSRSFPNAVKTGDGKFATKAAYEAHLSANGIAEVGVRAKIKKPHGNKTIGTWR